MLAGMAAARDKLPVVLVAGLPAPPDDPAAGMWLRVLAAAAANRAPATMRAYLDDLRALQAHRARIDAGTDPQRHPVEALAWLCADGFGPATERLLAWIAAMESSRLAQATIARRVVCLRVLTRLARRLRRIDWEFDVEVRAPRPYRDTRGPGVDGVQALLRAAAAQPSPFHERDQALIWMLFGPALRRAEVLGLGMAHLDLAHDRVRILGKHRREREWVTIPPPAAAALRAWLSVRGDAGGAVFWALDRANRGAPLAPRGLTQIIHRLGARAGLRFTAARPHGLRHAAITAGLDATGGDTRAVQAFARLRDANTLRHYDDNREDLAGMVAGKVGAVIADSDR